MSDDRSNGIGWFVAGLGLGALVGVLYAPRSGRETRESLLSSLDEGRGQLNARSGAAREKVAGWVDRGKETVSRQKDQLSSALDAGRQAYREATEKKS